MEIDVCLDARTDSVSECHLTEASGNPPVIQGMGGEDICAVKGVGNLLKRAEIWKLIFVARNLDKRDK